MTEPPEASPETWWRVSPWDQRMHCFPDQTTSHAKALCTHTVPTERLTGGPAKSWCIDCILTLGTNLPEDPEEVMRWDG